MVTKITYSAVSHKERENTVNALTASTPAKSLAAVNPKLVAEWHPTKNGNLTPDMVMPMSRKKVWWKCSDGHEWQAIISSRSQGHGCPYCAGQKAIKGETNLATINPKLAAEWHPTKNDNLTPDMVTAGSNKKVWWQCAKGHEWQAMITDRNQGNGCPYCAGQKAIKGKTDLATINPKLAAEWHPTKNGDLTPDMVTSGSNKKVWWKCSKEHEWQATTDRRTKGCGCPYCAGQKAIKGYNDLATTNPKLAAEWHPTKNGDLTPNMVMPMSGKKVWWQCAKGHEWQARIADRSQGCGCPICSKEKQTSFPEQAVYYYIRQHFLDAVNGYTGFGKELDIYIPSIRVAIEYDGSRFHKSVRKDKQKNAWCMELGIRLFRIRENGCPDINVEDVIIRKNNGDASLEEAINILLKTLGVLDFATDINADRNDIYNNYILSKKQKSLAAVNPKLAAEWHPTKNGSLTPDMVTAGSNKKVWWKCTEGHEWQTTINSRNNGCDCPYCAGKKVLKGYNDLASTNPKLAAEWHPTKNGDLTPDIVMAGSGKKVWWQCAEGHEWQTTINNRNQGSGCPYCSGRKK